MNLKRKLQRANGKRSTAAVERKNAVTRKRKTMPRKFDTLFGQVGIRQYRASR